MKSQGFDRVRFNRNQEKLIFSSASMKTLPLFNKTPLKTSQKRLITVPLTKKEQEEKIYEWRAKTEFPIARVLHFWQKQSNCSEFIFEVQVEDFSVRLADLQNVSLFKMLYLLKEALIGFERLFHMYGPFVLTSRMVALNKANKCKVWLADDFASNVWTPAHFTQQGFLAMLFRLFEQKANKLKSTRVFFQQLTQCSSFCGALAFIEDYAKLNKITLLSSCKLTPQEIVQRKGFQGTRTMNQAPKSLTTIPLRISFDHQSKNPLLDVLPSLIQDPQQVSTKLKNSDDTAAQAFSKKSNGLDPEDQFFLESSLLNNQEPSEPLAKSQLQAKGKPNINFIRKFSEQSPYLTPAKSKGSLGLHPKLPRSRWNQNSFVNCQVQQKANFNNVFNQHKWEKTLNGLFCDSEENSELKKSIHEGKEQRRTDQKFQLLDKFGKAIQESLIHEEDLNQN